MSTAPDAVLFDLDGTLIDTEPLCEVVVREVCGEIGIEISAAWYETLVGTGWELMFDELARGRDRATRDWIGQQVTKRYDIALAADSYQVPGGAAFLEHLHRHVPVAIVTGSTRRQLGQLVRQLGVA
ncbi:MAG: HAD family phosphatase, partial [Proteobacteria bacterium]|nr:HAD family phosphatase [Pseudomonadota bacterium]